MGDEATVAHFPAWLPAYQDKLRDEGETEAIRWFVAAIQEQAQPVGRGEGIGSLELANEPE